jgi:hypothetical protein
MQQMSPGEGRLYGDSFSRPPMRKPDDVSRHAPQRSSPRNSIKLVHTDDGATSPETRPPPALTADAVSRRVLGLWERALDAIDAGNLDAIAREIEWVIKYQLIQQYRAEHDVPLCVMPVRGLVRGARSRGAA